MVTKFEWTNELLVELLQFQRDFLPGYPHSYVIGAFIHEKMKGMDRKPEPKDENPVVFTSADGKEMRHGDTYWFTHANTNFPAVLSAKVDKILGVYYNNNETRFSDPQLAKEHLEKVMNPVVFTTSDGVDIRKGGKYWTGHASGVISGEFICDGRPDINYNTFNKREGVKTFSSRELAIAYVEQHQPIFSKQELRDIYETNKFKVYNHRPYFAQQFLDQILKSKP